MFELNGIEWRSLTEQVETNKNNIINILNGGLTDTSGLSIKYSVPTVADLPPGSIGDGAVVGTEGNYALYAFLKSPDGTESWLLLSDMFPAKGPQGEQGTQGDQGLQGEKGEQGTRGSYWFTTNDRPNQSDLLVGDLWLLNNGDVYQNQTSGWQFKTNILGQQGPQGEKGLDGQTPYIQNGNWWIGNSDTGVQAQGKNATAVVIQDGVYTPNTVPNFSSTQPLDGYIVQTNVGYDLYIHAVNGTSYTIVSNWGGVPGPAGPNGADGASVRNVHAIKVGETPADVIYQVRTILTNGDELNSGTLNIPKGPQGPQGEKGEDGFITTQKQLIDIIYPIGTYYQTAVKDFDPNISFGGKWYLMPAKAVLWSWGDNQQIWQILTIDGEKVNVPPLMEQGLPNIYGKVNVSIPWSRANNNGALSVHESWTNFCNGSQHQSTVNIIEFNASNYNPTYGRSNEVRPPNFRSYIWYRYK